MSLLNFKTYQVDDKTWTPIMLGASASRLWIDFESDLKLRSKPEDETTETVLSASQGTRYMVPSSVVFSSMSGMMPLVYAQSAVGSQQVKLSYVAQL